MSDFRAINKLLPPASHMGLIEEGYGDFHKQLIVVGFSWESGCECLRCS